MNGNGDKLHFSFDKCPNCGSTERLAIKLMEKEKAKGRLKEDATGSLGQLQTVAIPSALIGVPGIKLATLNSIVDACAQCGTMYIVEAAEGEIISPVQLVQNQPRR